MGAIISSDRRDAAVSERHWAMTSYSTGPFDPIAQAPDSDDPGPRMGPPGDPSTGPPSEPFPVDRRLPAGSEPPDRHHEAARPDALHAGASHPEYAGASHPEYAGASHPEYAGASHPEYAGASHPDPGHHRDAAYSASALAREKGEKGLYGRAGDGDEQVWAMTAYLGMIFFAFLPPLAVYLLKRESRYVRFHAAQALNLWITTVLYALSFVIIGGVLALDTVGAALSVGIPLVAASAIAMLLFAIRAGLAAGSGSHYQIPGWICVPMVT